MSPHKQVYCDFFGLTEADCPLSEISGSLGVDVHCIQPSGRGGKKEPEDIENLILLSRAEHDKWGGRQDFKHALYYIHLNFIKTMKPNYEIKEKYQQYLERPDNLNEILNSI